MLLKIIVGILLGTVLTIGLSASIIDAIYGGGEAFPVRITEPKLDESELVKVADLPYPPGNIAVSRTGRVFFTYHPEGKPEVNLAEWDDGDIKTFPFSIPAHLEPQTILSMRIDSQDRLWTLDYADHGMGQPRLLAFDLHDKALVHRFDIPSKIAGLGSHMNDFQVSPDGRYVYIADASIMGKDPAVIVYDTEKKKARRVIENHPTVEADDYVPVVQGEKMLLFGVFAVKPGVDSIALDHRGEWLYFAPVTEEYLYRVKTQDLIDETLDKDTLYSRIESVGPKSMSDGLSMDRSGNVYITDIEHSAINVVPQQGDMYTLIKSDQLRWPDGLSFGPDGWLFITASSLHTVIGKPHKYTLQNAPYQIFKIQTGQVGRPGH